MTGKSTLCWRQNAMAALAAALLGLLWGEDASGQRSTQPPQMTDSLAPCAASAERSGPDLFSPILF